MLDQPQPRVTLAQVARLAGVSLATASRAVNGSEIRAVGEELRQRVTEAADLLGYAPDANAQAMSKGMTRSVGVIVNDLTDPYFAAIAAGIASVCEDEDLFLSLATTRDQLERLPDIVRSYDSLRVRAIIMVGGASSDARIRGELLDAFKRYSQKGGRVVTVGVVVNGFDHVVIDDTGGAKSLAQKLALLGYRHPVLIEGPEDHTTARVRSHAFIRAAKQLGCEVPKSHRVACDFTRGGGIEAMRLILESRIEADVVVATNDVMALGAMAEARAAGLHIGEELGFAGFGDISGLNDAVPSLTTVRVPLEAMGESAVRLALAGSGDGTKVIRLPVHVVIRDSTPSRVADDTSHED